MALATGCAQQTATVKPYSFWPPYPLEPRVLFLESYSANTDLEPPKSQLDEIISGKSVEQSVVIGNPYGIAMHNGRIYICDTKNPAIEILDLHKHHMELMTAPETARMLKPVAITITPDGTKYIADIQAGQVLIFDPSDRFVRSITHPNFRPAGVAVFGNTLYVVDHKANHVEVFDLTTGNSIRTIGSIGVKVGQMVGPLGVAVDDQGFVYVDDIINCRVQKFSPEGKYVSSFGSLGDHPGTFTRPKQIAVDHNGVIYIVDAAFQNVQMFDNKYRALLFFGNPGTYPGAMDLPAGIALHDGDLDLFAKDIPDAFEAQQLVLVTNQIGTHKVSIYALGHLKPNHSMSELASSAGVVTTTATTQPTTGVGAPLPEQK
jgi:DNA-binding beta-propeller fold protein YncE